MKKKTDHLSPVKVELELEQQQQQHDETEKTNGNSSPAGHRRRPKRASTNGNVLLSTVSSVHELTSFVIHKDNPPQWLKQTDLYREYQNKSQQITNDNASTDSWPQYYLQSHRKQRSNLHVYARTDLQCWLNSSPVKTSHRRSRESPSKVKREMTNGSSPPRSDLLDLSTPLNISVKEESPLMMKKCKSKSNEILPRRQILCKKKLAENSPSYRRLRRQRTNSVENQEPFEKKDSSSSSSTSSQSDSSSSSLSSSSIEHTSPSPTTTVSRSSSRRSSPLEYMRAHTSINTRSSSPMKLPMSLSPSTPQRRSTRIWAPSNFYIDPVWILPTVVSSKRLLVQNSSSSPPMTPTESIKRPRRQCRS